MNEDNTQNKTDRDVLHTYMSDMADIVKKNEVSVIKIALAEQNKKERENIYREVEKTNWQKIALFVGGIIFIVLAIVGSYLLYKEKNKPIDTTTLPINNVDSFIFYDKQTYIDTTGIVSNADLSNSIKEEVSKKGTLGKVSAVFFKKKTAENQEVLITAQEFLDLLKSTIPSALSRSLTKDFLVGTYTTTNPEEKSHLFLVFQSNDYATAYSGMLNWEDTIVVDLFNIFGINISSGNNNLVGKTWKDTIIENRDSRVLLNDNNEEILYYTFINKDLFIITDNKETLKEINSKIIMRNSSKLL